MQSEFNYQTLPVTPFNSTTFFFWWKYKASAQIIFGIIPPELEWLTIGSYFFNSFLNITLKTAIRYTLRPKFYQWEFSREGGGRPFSAPLKPPLSLLYLNMTGKQMLRNKTLFFPWRLAPVYQEPVASQCSLFVHGTV